MACLCVGVLNKCHGQWNCWIWWSDLFLFLLVISSELTVNKVTQIVRKSRHQNPVFGHIRDEISKNIEKKSTLGLNGAQEGLKLRLGPHLLLIWVRPVGFFFPERLQPITAAAMCTISINALQPFAFNPESEHFIPLFNKISWLWGQQSRGDEASKWGVELRPN
jgi:hypothetical protein